MTPADAERLSLCLAVFYADADPSSRENWNTPAAFVGWLRDNARASVRTRNAELFRAGQQRGWHRFEPDAA